MKSSWNKSYFKPTLFAIICLVCFETVRAKYPNEIVNQPIITCEPDRIVIKIRTSTSNPSHIYAEDFNEMPKCTVKNKNKIEFLHGDCGMTTEHIENPTGTLYRLCIYVQIHPLFVTDSDGSFCAQCVYMETNVVDDLSQNIAINSLTPIELEPQFEESSNLHCTYSIRKGSVDGPEVHAAVVGDTVFHVWQCDNENVGILVQNCHVEDLQSDKILIIDQNGCGVDQYLFKTPEYSNDLHTAFLESNVFKFVDKSMTRFRCQLRLCGKNRGNNCKSMTPPTACPTFDEYDTENDAEVFATTVSTFSNSIFSDAITVSENTGLYRQTKPSIQDKSEVEKQTTKREHVFAASATKYLPSLNKTLLKTTITNTHEGYNVTSNLTSPLETIALQALDSAPINHNNNLAPPSPISFSSFNYRKTIGPPSIRPFGLSTPQHIVSGQTNGPFTLQSSGQAGSSLRSSRFLLLSNNKKTTIAEQPTWPLATNTLLSDSMPSAQPVHLSGYSFRNRNRRSIMIYGQATRPKKVKRSTTLKLENIYNETLLNENEKPIQKLDVVGQIQVHDSIEDLEYFEDKKKVGGTTNRLYLTNNGNRRYVTTQTSLPTTSTTLPSMIEKGTTSEFLTEEIMPSEPTTTHNVTKLLGLTTIISDPTTKLFKTTTKPFPKSTTIKSLKKFINTTMKTMFFTKNKLLTNHSIIQQKVHSVYEAKINENDLMTKETLSTTTSSSTLQQQLFSSKMPNFLTKNITEEMLDQQFSTIDKKKLTQNFEKNKNCLSIGVYWFLIFMVSLLAILQILIVVVFLTGRFPAGKALKRRVYDFIAY